MDSSGGPPQTISDAPNPSGGTWNREGIIAFSQSAAGPLYQVPAAGGEPKPLTTLGDDVDHRWPSFLPDGRHFLFLAVKQMGLSQVCIGFLDSSEIRRFFTSETRALYSPPGYLLFLHRNTLLAQAFDLETLTTKRDPSLVVEGVARPVAGGFAPFSVSENGTLAYESIWYNELVWFDREGKHLGQIGKPGLYRQIALSPGGEQVAVQRIDPGEGSAIWLFELESEIFSRLTFHSFGASDPLWTPDGRKIAFSDIRNDASDLFLMGVGEGEQVMFESDEWKWPEDWTQDGLSLIYLVGDPAKAVHLLPMLGNPQVVAEDSVRSR